MRALPWIQEVRAEQRQFLDCGVCLEQNPEELRSHMGCPYAPSVDTPLSVWQHRGDESAPPSTCPGYTTQLPDVVDIAFCFRWFEKAQLSLRVGDDPPLSLAHGLEILDNSVERLRAWRMQPKRDG